MKFTLKPLNEAGDTLVEVLIAIAIISSVLTGAFLVSQKSTMAVRSSQEQGEMLQLLQGQVELIRGIAMDATDNTDDIFRTTEPRYFCIDTASKLRVDFPSNYSLPTLPADDFTGYPAACKQLGAGELYNVAAIYTGDPDNVFTVTGLWDGPAGRKKEVLYYRVYPGADAVAVVPPAGPPAAAPGTVDARIGKGNPADPGSDPGPADPSTPPGPKCYEQTFWLDPQCWMAKLYNDSDNPQGVLQCIWDWGDGPPSPITYPGSAPQCQPNALVTHQYVPDPSTTEPNRITFDVTLTNVSADGSGKTSFETIKVKVPH